MDTNCQPVHHYQPRGPASRHEQHRVRTGHDRGFSIAALCFYSALDNPATQRARTEWGGHLAGVFLRALAVMFVASMVCGFTAISVPNRLGAMVFLVAMLTGFTKLGRTILIVAALPHGQRYDAQQKPVAVRTTRRPMP